MSVASAPRQIVLPLSKSIEIAWKSLRLRFGRSLLVTSGIALALAFLTSILASDALVDSLRQWTLSFPRSPEYIRLQSDRMNLEHGEMSTHAATLRTRVTEASAKPEGTAVDAVALFGDSLSNWQSRLGEQLPAPEPDIVHLLSVSPGAVSSVRDWLDDAKKAHALQARLLAPAQLLDRMHNAGVPSTADEVRSNRLQTRWLTGLALLVAFVGILNAMVMSVTERFREIGTMKCLGALDGFIVKLFLIESLMQGFVGTLVGVAAGLALSLASESSTYGGRVWTLLPVSTLCIRVLGCVAVGVVLTVAGAVYPAWQAARMEPIEAMRSET